MTTRNIDFSLYGREFTVALLPEQLTGIEVFIRLYINLPLNNRGLGDSPLEMLGDEPEDEWFATEGRNGNITLFAPRNGEVLEYEDWNPLHLQGLITAAQWLGVNWRDYVTKVTINGIIADVV